MKSTGIALVLLVLLTAPAWATEPPTAEVEIALTAEDREGPACDPAPPLTEEEYVSWAEEQGFEVSPLTASNRSAPSCPPIVSCNATHCVETSFCTTTDFGSSSCSGHVSLSCPQGTTIKLRHCRCAGGGCMVRRSQTFFCL